uniref:Nucleolar protein 9-like n=1 Tax=Hirondellea gigas TaxID=1518452 RepID=A0A2P2I313_9CRUS
MLLSQNINTTDSDEKEATLNAFFGAFTEEDGQRFICNQIISKMLDRFLPQASVSSLQHIMSILSKDLWAMCTDQFASHVLQTVLVITIRLIQADVKKLKYVDDKMCNVAVTDEEKQNLKEFITKVSKYCNNNLNDFICETYASHIIRTLLEVLSGVVITSGATGKETSRTPGGGWKTTYGRHQLKTDASTTIVVPEELRHLLPMVANRLQQVADLPSIISTECGSAVYQAALQVLRPNHMDALCLPLIQHLLTHAFCGLQHEDQSDEYNSQLCNGQEEQSVHPVFTNNATARLLEAVVQCSSGTELLVSIYSSYFEGKLDSLVQHRTAHFAVRSLLDAWTDRETFEGVSDAVSKVVCGALSQQHNSVVLSWVQACRRLNTQQGKCCLALLEALECSKTEEREKMCSPCLIHLMPHDQYLSSLAGSRDKPKVTLHGALILQEIFNFKKPIKFVKSLLDMAVGDLVLLFCDPRGSHIADAFCSSQHIGEKSRGKIICRIENEAVALALSKHGSRSLEAFWAVSCSASRTIMCQRLADGTARLKGNEFGTIIYSKFNVRLFSSRTNKEDWAKAEQAKINKRRKLQELLDFKGDASGGSESPAKKKKKKQSRPEEEDD